MDKKLLKCEKANYSINRNKYASGEYTIFVNNFEMYVRCKTTYYSLFLLFLPEK